MRTMFRFLVAFSHVELLYRHAEETVQISSCIKLSGVLVYASREMCSELFLHIVNYGFTKGRRGNVLKFLSPLKVKQIFRIGRMGTTYRFLLAYSHAECFCMQAGECVQICFYLQPYMVLV